MTDRPIIFSAPMVNAILSGRKSMTRRILKPQPPAQPPAYCHPAHQPRHAAPYLDAYCGEPCTKENPRGMSRNWHWWQVDDRPGLVACRAPCVPGDRLWVREGFSYDILDVDRDGIPPPWYWADGNPTFGDWTRPKPSIHMPRWASRLTLIVTDVRVQRLQDISNEDAIAEGTEPHGHAFTGYGKQSDVWMAPYYSFAILWTSIHGPDAWDANPWVAAISFETHKCNIDKMPGGKHE